MEEKPFFDMPRLRADMAAAVAKTSGRQFSLGATWGKNADFYRNFVANGQDKRLSADVYLGIVKTLGKEPWEYVIGAEPQINLPSAAVLMNTFSLLLDSMGIDPVTDGRAQKLALQFPNALKRSLALHAQSGSLDGLPLSEGPPADGEDRVPA